MSLSGNLNSLGQQLFLVGGETKKDFGLWLFFSPSLCWTYFYVL
jgi:hypothetical protein